MKTGSLLQLSIEPDVRNFDEAGGNSREGPGNRNKMNVLDWKRGATEVLLKLYKEHPILYNMRHPKYYNKSERQMALNTIIDLLEDHRPGTTTNDILKKIQTMRTQFGQEYGKVRRAQDKGSQYVPTVWWYSYLSFLRHHIRPRNARDPEPEQEPAEEDNSYQQGDEEYEAYTEVYDDENDDSEVVYEIQSATPGKDTKSDLLGQTKLLRKSHNVMTTLNGAKEEIIFEITDADTVVPKRKHEQLITSDPIGAAVASPPPVKILRQEVIATPKMVTSLAALPELATPTVAVASAATTPAANTSSAGGQESVEVSVESDRARNLGNFVASQISGIKDDFLFYSTQMDVLNVINKALLKQLHMDKEEKAGKKAKADD